MNALDKVCSRAIILMKFVCIVLCLTNCRQGIKIILSNNPVLFYSFPKEEKVIFKKIDEYRGGIPKRMFLVDSTLIIFNYSKNIKHFFFNYSLNTGKFSKGYLGKGRGPNEAIGAKCSGIHKNVMWMYDGSLNQILTVDKAAALSGGPLLFKKFPVDIHYYKLTIIDNLQFLSVGEWNSKFKIQRVDLVSNKKIAEFGRFIGDIEDMPMDGITSAYQSFIYSKPSGEKIILAYRFTDAIEVYDLKNQNSCKTVQGPLGFDIDLKFQSRGTYTYFAKDEKTRKAFVGGTVTDKYIYLLYSGQVRLDANWSFAKYIYVYDWDGNPVKRLSFDGYISSLVVSDDNRTIYAFDVNSGYIVKTEID